MLSLAVFAFSAVLLLCMSGTYHLLTPGTAGRAVLQRLDHGAVFVLIAGTFTPLQVILFRGAWRWAPLLVLWASAAAGVTFKSIFFESMAEWLGLLFYLVMGWLGAISASELLRRHESRLVRPLVLGGVAYTVGGVLEYLRWPVVIAGVIGPHEAFHGMVLLGLGFHWRFIWLIAHGVVPPRRGESFEVAVAASVPER
jgi:channel protein (hemolysin III family)